MPIEVAGSFSSGTCQKSALKWTRKSCSGEVLPVVICYNTTQTEVPGGAAGHWVWLAALQCRARALEKLLSLRKLAGGTQLPNRPNQGARVYCWSRVCGLCETLEDSCPGRGAGARGEARHAVQSCQVSPPEPEAKIFSSRPHSSRVLFIVSWQRKNTGSNTF